MTTDTTELRLVRIDNAAKAAYDKWVEMQRLDGYTEHHTDWQGLGVLARAGWREITMAALLTYDPI
jgi:hypothetical protein